MKILFLDIDGVLNHTAFLARVQDDKDFAHLTDFGRYVRMIDPVAVGRLNRIVDATDAKIVISSTWRRLMTAGQLRKALERAGLKSWVFSQTPCLLTPVLRTPFGKVPTGAPAVGSVQRGREIESWLVLRKKKLGVTRFVILDDDSDMEPYMDRLVQTSMKEGLQDEHVEKAIELLGRTPAAEAT